MVDKKHYHTRGVFFKVQMPASPLYGLKSTTIFANPMTS